MTTVDVAALLQEMQEVMVHQAPAMSPGDDPGMTVIEWGDVWRINHRSARMRLRGLFEQGLIITGRRNGVGMDGRHVRIPVYRAKT